jgi:DNA-binding transcriptional LysR family regulator
LDIEDVVMFAEVAEAGGISAAARRLGISKSIVSRRLVRLEADLGVQLLARSTRGAALTEAGETFRDHAARIGTEYQSAKDAVLPTGDLRGRLRISLPLTFGPTHFAPVLTELAQRHPRLHIHSVYSDRFVDLIAEGFDCALRIGLLKDSNLIARRVGPVYGRVVASPDYIRKHGAPERPDEILSHEALMQGNETWQFLDRGKLVNVQPQGRFKADDGMALTTAAVAGLGIARLPDGLSHPYRASGALVTIMTDYPLPVSGAYVVRPQSRHPARSVRILTEMLIQHFESNPELWGMDEASLAGSHTD